MVLLGHPAQPVLQALDGEGLLQDLPLLLLDELVLAAWDWAYAAVLSLFLSFPLGLDMYYSLENEYRRLPIVIIIL